MRFLHFAGPTGFGSIRLPGLMDLRTIDAGRVMVAIGILGLSVATGVAAVGYPLLAFVLAGAVLVLGAACRDTAPMERLLAMILLFGGFVLGYGFANLGLGLGAVPLPATEMLFLPLAVVALARRDTRIDAKVLIPMVVYAGVILTRLVFDYPKFGALAIRDTTMAFEIFIIAVGYRAVARDGIRPWIKRFGFVLVAVLLYGGLLYPWEDLIADVGPTVGLQRPVPLFDLRGTKFSVVAAALFFLTYRKGWKQTLPVGLVFGLLAVFQARTLYILFPLSIILLGWLRRQQLKMLMRLVPVALFGIVLLLGASKLSLEGRRGAVDASFVTAHARTLLGEEGPASGTIEGRQKWFTATWSETTKNIGTTLTGLGLGVDLTFGMLHGDEGQDVRKPHDDYLEIFGRFGVLGFSIFLWMLISCLAPIARKARRREGETSVFCAWIFAATLVYLGVAGAQPLLSFSYGSIPLFFLLGMGVAAARRGDARDPSIEAAR